MKPSDWDLQELASVIQRNPSGPNQSRPAVDVEPPQHRNTKINRHVTVVAEMGISCVKFKRACE